MNINEFPPDILKFIFGFLLLKLKTKQELSLVCHLWRDVIADTPFLSLDASLQKFPNRAVMAMAPVKSSGDIYHMVAFLALSLYHKKQIPPIFLAYDKQPPLGFDVPQTKANTGLQVKRELSFVSCLYDQECFSPLTLNQARSEKLELDKITDALSGMSMDARPVTTCYQPTARQKQLTDKLQERQVTHYIDHRFSTSVIADHICQYGLQETTEILRGSFRSRNQQYLSAQDRQAIQVYVSNTMQEIATDVKSNPEKKTVVIHYRVSSGANGEQDISGVAQYIITALAKNNRVIVIYADSRQANFSNLHGAHYHIRPFQQESFITEHRDLSKIAHLELLLAFFDKKDQINLQGIIGNTSGTLDLAAFIGHNVLDIHLFGSAEKGFDYQDYRLLLQMTFLSVEQLASDRQAMMTHIDSWLATGQQPKQEALLGIPRRFTGLGKIGFSFLSSVEIFKEAHWEVQRFFPRLKEAVNQKAKSAKLFSADFEPPLP